MTKPLPCSDLAYGCVGRCVPASISPPFSCPSCSRAWQLPVGGKGTKVRGCVGGSYPPGTIPSALDFALHAVHAPEPGAPEPGAVLCPGCGAQFLHPCQGHSWTPGNAAAPVVSGLRSRHGTTARDAYTCAAVFQHCQCWWSLRLGSKNQCSSMCCGEREEIESEN